MLRESEKRYRATFDHAAVGIAHIGLDGRWMRFNDAVCAITGYSREELNAKTFLEITHPADLETDLSLVRRLTDGEIPRFSLEKRYLRPDGSVVWVNLTASLLRDTAGSPLHYISVIEDITARKVAEAALQESEERYRSLVLATSAFVWTSDAAGDFAWPQLAWQAYTGQTWEECKGGNWIAAVHPEDRERVAEIWRAAVQAKSVYEVDWRAWHAATKEWRHCHTRAVPVLRPDGEVREWIGAVNDVHDRKLLEQRLQQEDKRESLGVLAGGVAHDFNNLLVGIMGNASLSFAEASPKQRPMLKEILEAAERAADLTRQMLAYAGKGQFVFESLDLSREVQEALKLARSSLGPAARVELDLARDLPPIRADRGQIQQIIMNLLINAGEALGSHGGQIRVFTSVECAPSERVVLTVQDDGAGMTPEVKGRIFDPFFTTKFTGRGLGLAAVMGIVRAHNGFIEVDSMPGRGTTFRVSLPATQFVEPADRQQLQPDALPSVAMTVLLIDDEDVVRNIARHTLTLAGARCLVASSGREGIQMFREWSREIDVVVLDAIMPDLGGLEVLREIRGIRPGVPVIVSSGHPGSEIQRYFNHEAPSAILSKPYKPADLAEAVLTYGLRSKSQEA
jgi:PAS domain S-box-containing protein